MTKHPLPPGMLKEYRKFSDQSSDRIKSAQRCQGQQKNPSLGVWMIKEKQGKMWDFSRQKQETWVLGA